MAEKPGSSRVVVTRHGLATLVSQHLGVVDLDLEVRFPEHCSLVLESDCQAQPFVCTRCHLLAYGPSLDWKILTGSIFGVVTYFIRRFAFEWEFLVAIPLFAIISYGIAIAVVAMKMKDNLDTKEILKTAAGYTGTWFMCYLVFGGLTYLGGW